VKIASKRRTKGKNGDSDASATLLSEARMKETMPDPDSESADCSLTDATFANVLYRLILIGLEGLLAPIKSKNCV
jgi:hypothetical protein